MQQLLYVSNTSRDTDQALLEAILHTARTNNQRLGVTGMLLYADGGFLQVLEGEPDILNRLYTKICADKRHWNTHVLLQRESPRAFAEWSMGFHRLSETGEAMFRISADAINGRLKADEHPILLRFMENFYRIQSGEDRLPT